MNQEFQTLFINLAVASGMVAVTVLIHFSGLLRLSHLMRGAHARLKTQTERMRQALTAAAAISASDVTDPSLDGKALGDAIRALRVQAIRQIYGD